MPDKIEIVHFTGDEKFMVDAHDNHLEETENPPPGNLKLVHVRKKTGESRNSSLNAHSETSRRSVQKQVSHGQITHDDPSNAEIVDSDADFALPTNLLVAGLIQVFVGGICLSLSAVLFFANSAIEVFLEVSGFHAHSVVVFVIASDGLKILAGIGLVVCLLFNFNSFFRMYPNLLWVILMLDMVSVVFSIGKQRDLNMSIYARMFESEAMIFCEGNYEYYNMIWDRPPNSEDPEPRMWGKLESTLRCCGFNGAEDWPTVCHGKVPFSCCRHNSMKKCRKTLNSWNNAAGLNDTSSDVANISAVRHLLYQKSCRNVLNLEAESIQRDWILFPFIVGLFDLVLMINGNHKIRKITLRLNSSTGVKELARFRNEWWTWLKCHYRSGAEPAKSSDVKEENIQSPNAELSPPKGEFVTDRESLLGLVQTKSGAGLPSNMTSAGTVVIRAEKDEPLKKEN